MTNDDDGWDLSEVEAFQFITRTKNKSTWNVPVCVQYHVQSSVSYINYWAALYYT